MSPPGSVKRSVMRRGLPIRKERDHRSLPSGPGSTLTDPHRSTTKGRARPIVKEEGASLSMAVEHTPQPSLPAAPRAGEAITVRRKFTQPGVHPFDTVEWELRDARIGHGDRVAFEQR